MTTIELKIDDDNYKSFLIIINNLKDGFIKGFTVTQNDTYIDDIGDRIEIINEEEFVVPTDIDLKTREDSLINLKNGDTFSMEEILKERESLV
jgi:hypothetical protein